MEKYILIYGDERTATITEDPAEIEEEIRDLVRNGYDSSDLQIYKGKELKLEIAVKECEVAIGGEV